MNRLPSGSFGGLFDEVHTGPARCWPCTVVNVVLLAVLVGVVALGWWPAAAALALVGTAAIVFRGYLFPYTPRWAPRLAARLPGDVFDHGEGIPDGGSPPPASDSLGGDDAAADGERVLGALVEADVLVEGADLRLDESFRESWRAAMARVRDGDLASHARAISPAVADAQLVTETADDWVVLSGTDGGVENESWLSPPVAIAEVAAVESLIEAEVAHDVALAAATPLCMFLERCPVCDGPVEETVSRECCGGGTDPTMAPEDEVLACPSCDVRLYTF